MFAEAISLGETRTVLKCIRDETTYLVLLVRVRNDERRANAKEQREEEDLLARELKEKEEGKHENTLF